MDVVSHLLDGPRAQGAFLLQSVLNPPWSMRIEDEAPLTSVAMVRGHAWVIPDEGEAVPLYAGDVAILRGPDHYVFADDPATRPTVVIHPGQRCTTPDGVEITQMVGLGVRTWGNNAEGDTVLLTGTYQQAGEVSQRLLAALPPVVVVRHESWDSPLISLLSTEIAKDAPGQEAVLDRLLDLLLIAALRVWFADPAGRAPAWYRANDDPFVGRVLRLMHDAPGHPWTVALLANEVGVSRATLANRFTKLVGAPPMAYLAGWRVALAADLLLDTESTIAAVARQVGYGDAFALSTAFKRLRGVSPRDHRRGSTRTPSDAAWRRRHLGDLSRRTP